MCWKVGSNTKHPFLKATGLAKSFTSPFTKCAQEQISSHYSTFWTTFERDIFPWYACCPQTIQQDSSPRGPGRSLSGWTACVPRPLESSEAPTNTQTARFAQQALCPVHKVATVLIIPEDLGGHPANHLHSGR